MHAFGLQNINCAGHRRRTVRHEYGELSIRMFLNDERRNQCLLELHQGRLERLLIFLSSELPDHTSYNRKTRESTKQVLLEPIADAFPELCANQQTDAETNQDQQTQGYNVVMYEFL